MATNGRVALTESATVDEVISVLNAKGKEWAVQDGRHTGLTIAHLRGVCDFFNMTKRGTKAELLDFIFNKFKHVDAVATMASVAPPTTFVSDQNTFPRLCNIIMKYPQQLLATGVIATRVALQTNNVGANQSLWLDAAENFNNPTFPVGPVVEQHPAFVKKGIDPTIMNKSLISAEKCQTMFQDVIKSYAAIYIKYVASGKNNGHDFWSYCNGKVEPLYLHLCLVASHCEEVMSFCAEGIQHSGGFDTAAPAPSLSSPTAAATNEESIGRTAIPLMDKEEAAVGPQADDVMSNAVVGTPAVSTPVPAQSVKKRKARAIEDSLATYLFNKQSSDAAGVEDTRIAFLNDEIDKLEDQISQIRGDAGFTETDGRYLRKMQIMQRHSKELIALLAKKTM